jgi:hypothetical protein
LKSRRSCLGGAPTRRLRVGPRHRGRSTRPARFILIAARRPRARRRARGSRRRPAPACDPSARAPRAREARLGSATRRPRASAARQDRGVCQPAPRHGAHA